MRAFLVSTGCGHFQYDWDNNDVGQTRRSNFDRITAGFDEGASAFLTAGSLCETQSLPIELLPLPEVPLAL